MKLEEHIKELASMEHLSKDYVREIFAEHDNNIVSLTKNLAANLQSDFW